MLWNTLNLVIGRAILVTSENNVPSISIFPIKGRVGRPDSTSRSICSIHSAALYWNIPPAQGNLHIKNESSKEWAADSWNKLLNPSGPAPVLSAKPSVGAFPANNNCHFNEFSTRNLYLLHFPPSSPSLNFILQWFLGRIESFQPLGSRSVILLG